MLRFVSRGRSKLYELASPATAIDTARARLDLLYSKAPESTAKFAQLPESFSLIVPLSSPILSRTSNPVVVAATSDQLLSFTIKPAFASLRIESPHVNCRGSTLQSGRLRSFSADVPKHAAFFTGSNPSSFLMEGGEGESGQSPVATKRFRVYTKTGDKGTSSLYTGERRRKDDAVFEALGDVDELNSSLGLAREYCLLENLTEMCSQIGIIQSRLLDVGSAVATPISSSSARKLQRVRFDPTAVGSLEDWIDAMDESLAPLRFFILPSGGLASAHLHMARSICRRAERRVVALEGISREDSSPTADEEGAFQDLSISSTEKEGSADSAANGKADEAERRPRVVEEVVPIFLNRLSDYLFTCARFAAVKAGRMETTYQKAT